MFFVVFRENQKHPEQRPIRQPNNTSQYSATRKPLAFPSSLVSRCNCFDYWCFTAIFWTSLFHSKLGSDFTHRFEFFFFPPLYIKFKVKHLRHVSILKENILVLTHCLNTKDTTKRQNKTKEIE